MQAEGCSDLVKFLQELCGLARHTSPANRADLLGQLVNLGLFEVQPFLGLNKIFVFAWSSVVVPMVYVVGCVAVVFKRQKACALEADKTSLKRKGKERLHLVASV